MMPLTIRLEGDQLSVRSGAAIVTALPREGNGPPWSTDRLPIHRGVIELDANVPRLNRVVRACGSCTVCRVDDGCEFDLSGYMVTHTLDDTELDRKNLVVPVMERVVLAVRGSRLVAGTEVVVWSALPESMSVSGKVGSGGACTFLLRAGHHVVRASGISVDVLVHPDDRGQRELLIDK